jgi:hypothetical protein
VPDVFLDDLKLKALWSQPQRYYLVAKADNLPRFVNLLGPSKFELLKTSGGKILLTNQSITRTLGGDHGSNAINEFGAAGK